MKSRWIAIVALSVGLLSAASAHANICRDIFDSGADRLSDWDIELFLGPISRSARPGQGNADILSYFQANRDRLSLPSVVRLVQALRPAGKMPVMTGQFFRFMTKDDVQFTIVDQVLASQASDLKEFEVQYMLELVQNERYRGILTDRYLSKAQPGQSRLER